MTAWDRMLGWLRGPGGRSDRGGSEQVAFVRPYEAPALRQVLDQNGIPCEIVGGRNHATWEPMAALMVSSVDSARAVDVIRRFRES
jgi:hypothetical protein